MIDIAVVGVGIIGADHLKAIERCSEFRLVAVCDKNEERARSFSEKYSVPYFLDYKDITKNTSAKAVILNLPHGLHCESAVYFLGEDMDVLLEKPMANTVEECDRILQAVQESRGKLAIGHVQRFFNANRLVKEYVESGRLGRLFAINELRSVNYFTPDRPRWFLSKSMAGGGIVMNYGAHAFDKFLYITGRNVDRVWSSVGNIGNNEEIEGHAQIFAHLEGGISATITFSGYSSVGYETEYIFTGGALKVTNGRSLSICENGAWSTVFDEPDRDFMLRQLNEFYKYVTGEPCETPDGEYGRAIISAIEKIYG